MPQSKKHSGEAKAGTIEIFRPRTGGKQFEPLALINFKTPTLKYAFERAFASWKRSNPSDKLSISRAPPAKSPGDEDQPTPNDLKKRIGGLYNVALQRAFDEKPNFNFKLKKLTDEQMMNMPVNLKTKYKPIATFWEYLCPTNNITYNVYMPVMDPFDGYNFTAEIPNPVTRKAALTAPAYTKYYELKTFKK